MSGILDKSRIIDFVITENGRSQIQNGDIRYKFATISDKSIVYTKDHEKSISKKANVSNSELNYIPIETFSKVNNDINLEFDLRNYFLNDGSSVSGNRTINFEDKVDDYFTNFSLGSYLENLRYLTTSNSLNDNVNITFEDTGYLNNEINFNNSILSYDTVKNRVLKKDEALSIALDKRFSHKRNFMILPPINSQNEEIYERDNFKNIDNLDEENSTGFLLNSHKSLSTSKKMSRSEEILSIIRNFEKNQNVFKKVYKIEKPSSKNSIIFEMFEKDENTHLLQKLHFIEIGKFFDKNVSKSKKVYLIGKIINTKDDISDLDVFFNFNNGVINLEKTSNFALSAYFSFICMFVLVVE